MNQNFDELKRIWRIDMEIASLNFKLYALFDDNRILAIMLFGLRAQLPSLFDDYILSRMDHYVIRSEISK